MKSPHYGNCRWAGKPGHTISGASRSRSSRSARALATRLIALTLGAAASVRVIYQEFVMLPALVMAWSEQNKFQNITVAWSYGLAWKPRHKLLARSGDQARISGCEVEERTVKRINKQRAIVVWPHGLAWKPRHNFYGRFGVAETGPDFMIEAEQRGQWQYSD